MAIVNIFTISTGQTESYSYQMNPEHGDHIVDWVFWIPKAEMPDIESGEISDEELAYLLLMVKNIRLYKNE